MPTARSDAAALTVQLEDVWTSLLVLGRQLSADEWARPTSCPGWDVLSQYAHVLGTESMLAKRPPPPAVGAAGDYQRNPIGEANEAWVTAWRGRPPAELLDTLAAVVDERLAALRAMGDEDFAAPSWTPVGQGTYGRFMQLRVFDCWVHEQDVRAATDRPGHADGPAAEQAIDEIERNLGYVVGKRAGAPPGSLVAFDLTGPVLRRMFVEVSPQGRAGVVTDPGRPPDAALRTTSTTFAALACGRVAPAEVADRLALEGDADLGGRLAGALAFTI